MISVFDCPLVGRQLFVLLERSAQFLTSLPSEVLRSAPVNKLGYLIVYRGRYDTYLFRATVSHNWMMMMRTSPPTDTLGNGVECQEEPLPLRPPGMAGIEYKVRSNTSFSIHALGVYMGRRPRPLA